MEVQPLLCDSVVVNGTERGCFLSLSQLLASSWKNDRVNFIKKQKENNNFFPLWLTGACSLELIGWAAPLWLWKAIRLEPFCWTEGGTTSFILSKWPLNDRHWRQWTPWPKFNLHTKQSLRAVNSCVFFRETYSKAHQESAYKTISLTVYQSLL